MARGISSQTKRSLERAAFIAIQIEQLRAAGIFNPIKLANCLNAKGIATVAGKNWSAIEIIRFQAKPPSQKALETAALRIKYGMI